MKPQADQSEREGLPVCSTGGLSVWSMWMASTRLFQELLLAMTESGPEHHTTMHDVLYHALARVARPTLLGALPAPLRNNTAK